MTQFLKSKNYLSFCSNLEHDFNVKTEFIAETSASSSVSSRLPVILLQKSSHKPCF